MNKPRRNEVAARIRFDRLDEEVGEVGLTLHAVSESGESLASTEVAADGSFAIADRAVESAHRIVFVGESGDLSDRTATVRMRPAAFRRAIELGEIAFGPRDWGRFVVVRRCADATIRRCFPWWPVIAPLLPAAGFRGTDLLGPSVIDPPFGPPFVPPFVPPFRCAPICEGVVEVYRRTCCCRPPVVEPPVFEPPVFEPVPLPDPIPDPFPDPVPGPFPGPLPGPDPVPFDVLDTILTEGALDVRKQHLARDRVALRQLTGITRPWRWCTCGGGTKVAEGFVGEGGRIHVCWNEPLRVIGSNCRDEYSFVVKQNITGTTVTIYNGPAAGQWFDAADDDVRLTSYHLGAVTCRDDGFPVDPGEPFVVLQDIGTTESHQLRTPLQDGPSSVNSFGPDSGLLTAGVDHALGGTLNLRYHFSASMQGIGARYYRVQVAPAGADGDPTGPWETVPVPTWETWRSSGTIEPGAHALGPHTVGVETDLFHIPFDTGAPLEAQEEWQDGQFHAQLASTQRPAGRYLVRIQVFDAAGTQMDPAGGTFTFRRWNTPTTTIPVTHDALTHGIRTDNRPVHGDIVDVVGPGAGPGDCKFFVGPASSSVGIDFAATHPAPGNADFLLSWSLSVRRGINGGTAAGPVTSTSERPSGGVPQSFTIGQLLDGEAKCSFTANLHVYARIHNGVHRISAYDRHDQASFAVEVQP